VRLFVFTLKRAANARERASAAVDEKMRQFHQATESKWMDSAASTAVAQRVDLFLQTREFRLRLSPSDLCPFYQHRMLPRLSNRALNLKPTSSNVAIVAMSIRDILVLVVP
jgi:hypothetical protein